MRYVLDTNIVARLLEGDPRVVPRVAGLEADSFGIPLVVFAELLFGVEKSARREANRARLERFAAGVRVLPFDLPLATRYSTVRATLERKGRPKTPSGVHSLRTSAPCSRSSGKCANQASSETISCSRVGGMGSNAMSVFP